MTPVVGVRPGPDAVSPGPGDVIFVLGDVSLGPDGVSLNLGSVILGPDGVSLGPGV